MPTNPPVDPADDEQSRSRSRRGFLQWAIAAAEAALVGQPLSERFGWSKRTAEPRSMRDGRTLVGWEMATATYPANRQAAKASASIQADGTALVRSGTTHDLGIGTSTVMTQIAAEALGMPVSKVILELGDTGLPEAPGSGGSQTVASVGPAVHAAAKAARESLVALAVATTQRPRCADWAGMTVFRLTAAKRRSCHWRKRLPAQAGAHTASSQ